VHHRIARSLNFLGTVLKVIVKSNSIINPAILNHNDFKSVLIDHPTDVPVISLI